MNFAPKLVKPALFLVCSSCGQKRGKTVPPANSPLLSHALILPQPRPIYQHMACHKFYIACIVSHQTQTAHHRQRKNAPQICQSMSVDYRQPRFSRCWARKNPGFGSATLSETQARRLACEDFFPGPRLVARQATYFFTLEKVGKNCFSLLLPRGKRNYLSIISTPRLT